MNKFIITEEEKSRILDMHKSRTSELYLNEDTSGTDWYAACTTFNSLPENKRNIVSFKNAASFVKDDEKRQQIFLSFGTPNGWCAKVNNYDKPDFNQLANKEISQGGNKYEDYDKFPTIVELLRRGSTQQHMNEAQQSVDLLTKEKLAQQMMGTTPAEISAAIKKFTVKDGKGKSLGSPDKISRTRKNDIILTFSKNPQLFDYGEKIGVSYNNTPLRQTSKLTQENEGMGAYRDYCQAVFSYQPEGLPSPMAIFVQFMGSKMKDVGNVMSWGKDALNKAKTQANNAAKQYAKNNVTVTRSR